MDAVSAMFGVTFEFRNPVRAPGDLVWGGRGGIGGIEDEEGISETGLTHLSRNHE